MCRISPGIFIILCLGSTILSAMAQEPQPPQNLSQLSLEDLTKVVVSSVSRKDQELFQTPAAVFVITHEDIRQSGATSLPELLRVVPGMQVAQIYADVWAVSSRGFNGRFADKMLVLIDGRSVYSEIYSGVYWGQNDLLLEDIDRIEVIRGPGGSLWGANAVNGIINVITLPADRTQGALFIEDVGRLGTVAATEYGGALGKQFRYRAYAKFLRHNDLVTDTGSHAYDADSSTRVGIHGDWATGPSDAISFRGDIYRGRGNERVHSAGIPGISSSRVETSGGYALGRWQHTFTTYDVALQSYYNQEDHVELSGGGLESTVDLDLITHLPRYKHNEPSLGAGYRVVSDRIMSSPAVFGQPYHRNTLASVFFEDDLSLVPRKLRALGGFKLFHNSYTGVEVQPSVRGIWTPNERRAVWAAASRAVRTPSIQELDLHYATPITGEGPIPTEVLAEGNPAFRSEVVYAYESGFRQSISHGFSIDSAGFFNKYRRLRSQSQLSPYLITSPSPEVIIPIVYGNLLRAWSDGIEAAVSWKPNRAFQIAASYSWINARLWTGNVPPGTTGDLWATPTNTLNLHGAWGFANYWKFYSSLYTVSKLPKGPPSTASIRAYARADVHLSYELKEHFQILAGADNLQRSRHAEFNPSDDGYSIGSQIPRNFFIKAVWSF